MAVQQRQFLDWRNSHGLDFGNDELTPLLEAQAWRESRGKHYDETKPTGLTTSPVGALGIAQIMPATAEQPGWGVSPLQDDSVEEALRFQRDYMTSLVRYYKGDTAKAVAAYNAGAGHINRGQVRADMDGGHWSDYLPMPEETLPYMNEIFGNLEALNATVNGVPVDVEDVDPEVVQEALQDESVQETISSALDGVTEADLVQAFQDVPGSFAEDLGLTEEEQETGSKLRLAVLNEGIGVETDDDGAEWMLDEATGKHIQMPPDPIQNATDDDLRQSSGWINSAFEMYTFWNHRPPPNDMSDADLADWGMQFMSNMEWSILDLGRISSRFSGMHDLRAKLAMVHMMDQFAEKEKSWEGAWRGTKAFVTDPFNVIGLTSFGTATAGKIALQQAALQTLKQSLMRSLGRSGAILGLEGALYTGTHNTLYQNLEMKLDQREEFSHLELLVSTAIGGTVGVVAGTAFDQVATRIATRMMEKKTISKAASRGLLSPDELEVMKHTLNPEDFKRLELEQTRIKLEGAHFKKPQGRSPEDDFNVTPKFHSERKLKKLGLTPAKIYEGFRATPRSLAEAYDFARPLAEALKGLSVKNVNSVIEGMRRLPFRGDQQFNMKESTGQAWLSLHMERADLLNRFHNVETDPRVLADLAHRIQKNEELYTPIRLMHEALGSEAGSALRAERGLRGKLRRFEVNEIMRQNPRLTRKEAEQLFIDQTARFEVDEAITKVHADYRVNLDDALKRGDWDQVKNLWVARDAEIDRLNDLVPHYLRDDLGYGQWAKTQNANRDFASFKDISTRLNEIFISNVFSSTTVLINLVPSGIKALARPGLDFLVGDVLKRQNWVEMVANYTAMAAGMKAAGKAASLAFKYEQSLLTGGHMRLLENTLANAAKRDPRLWDWVNNIRSSVPGAMRFFPRILNATDEGLSRIAYDGYVAGRAAGDAYATAIAGKRTPAQAEKLAKRAAREALRTKETVDGLDRKLNILLTKGTNLGYEGPALQQYVVNNFKDLKHVKLGDNMNAVDYAKDILYKKQFAEDTTLGKTGKWAEETMKDQPWIKWVTGQLFFRTPIRVVEEGLRYTPGIQYLMPSFRKDLLGQNGSGRQAAAMGQQFMSMVFASMVTMKYAEGDIKGTSMNRYGSDYRHRRLRYDAAGMEDYNVDLFGTGRHWSYRMFDPIATPFKIMVNTLEFFDHLKIREAQGEFLDSGLYGHAMATLSGVAMSAINSVADANLLGGITTTTRLMTGLENLEGDNNRFFQYMAERLKWTMPNTAHKLGRLNDGEFRDPSGSGMTGLSQNILTGLGPIGMALEEKYELHTPRAYDIFGNTRQLTNTNALFNLFGTSGPSDRIGDLTDMQMVVLDELVELQRRTNTFYHSEHQHSSLGDVDLRTILTSDGKYTLYDRWNQILATLPMDRVLFNFLMIDNIPEGVPGSAGARPQRVQQIIGQFRDQAMGLLAREEEALILCLRRKHAMRSGERSAGLHDAGRRTNQNFGDLGGEC